MNTSPRPPTPINTPSYPREFQQVILEKTQNFVGRTFVFTAISNFLQHHNRGYFTIIGAPGSGKSAILAKYVQENPHVIYYNAQLPGKNRAEEFLTSTCTQITHTPGDTSLYSLLQQVSDQLNPEQKLIIAIDALDAIDTSHQSPGSNIFYLPRYLPQKVYFLLSRRPFLKTKSGLLIEAPSQVLDLATYPQENQQDIDTYIRQYIKHDQELVAQLIAHSENNFMYLSQILPVISQGFDEIPPSLEAYYQQHLDKMIPARLSGEQRELRLSVLKVFAQVSSPLSSATIANTIAADEYDVEEVLENWYEFLTLQKNDQEISYNLYHFSFHQFLSKQLNQ